MDVSGFAIRYLDPRDGDWYDKWEEANLYSVRHSGIHRDLRSSPAIKVHRLP